MIKRKVVQHGPSTLIVSLPAKWVKKQGIKKGDEIELYIKNNLLLISSGKHAKTDIDQETSINIGGKKKITHRLISALYKAGYNKVTINFDNHHELQVAQSTISNELIGFEIINESKNFLTAKQITTINDEEFNNMLRRTFLFLLSIAEDSIESLKKKDVQTLQNITLRDTNVNKLTDYCRRAVNIKGIHLFKGRPSPVYYIIEQLEKIGDNYRDICKFCASNNIFPSKNTLIIHDMLNKFLRKFYELFYKFDLIALEEFMGYKTEIGSQIQNSTLKCSKNEIKIIMYYYSLLYNIFDMNGPLMAAVL